VYGAPLGHAAVLYNAISLTYTAVLGKFSRLELGAAVPHRPLRRGNSEG
jgi:hypothetical protein